jgi:hypothetical protein
MKRTLIFSATILLLLAAYFLSFRASCIRQVHPGDNEDLKLVVAGITFPYNSTTIKIFSFIYRPLIEDSAARQPTEIVKGTIRRIDLSKSEVMISREGKDGILLQIPEGLKPALTGFADGDPIRASYGIRPMKDSPFCYSFEIRTINHLAKQ